MFIAININGSIDKIEENLEQPTFFIQDGGYLLTNEMSGAARLPALIYNALILFARVLMFYFQNIDCRRLMAFLSGCDRLSF